MRDDELDFLQYGAYALRTWGLADYASWVFRWRNVAIVAFVSMVLGAAQMMTYFGIAPVENVRRTPGLTYTPAPTPTPVPTPTPMSLYEPKTDGTY